jgi:hypothetical protein
LQARAEKLVYNVYSHPVEVTTTSRRREDTLRGKPTA